MSNYQPFARKAWSTLLSLGEFTTDQRSVQCPPIRYMSIKIHRPPHVLSNALLFLLSSILLFNPSGIAPLLTQLVVLIPSTWGTIKFFASLPQHGKKDKVGMSEVEESAMKRWIDFWVVYGGFIVFESFTGDEILGTIVPIWWVGKVVLLGSILLSKYDSVEKVSERSAKGVKPEPLRLKMRKHVVPKLSPRPFQEITEPPPLPEHAPLIVKQHAVPEQTHKNQDIKHNVRLKGDPVSEFDPSYLLDEQEIGISLVQKGKDEAFQPKLSSKPIMVDLDEFSRHSIDSNNSTSASPPFNLNPEHLKQVMQTPVNLENGNDEDVFDLYSSDDIDSRSPQSGKMSSALVAPVHGEIVRMSLDDLLYTADSKDNELKLKGVEDEGVDVKRIIMSVKASDKPAVSLAE